MYIDAFWVGVAATVLVEVGLVIVAGIATSIMANRRKNRRNRERG